MDFSPSTAICRLVDICHYPSEAGVSRGGVKIPSQFGFLYLHEFSLQVWAHHAGSVSGGFLPVKAEIHI